MVEPEPDDKDWTWVLDAPCPECGFDAAAVHGRDVAAMLPALTRRWVTVLSVPDAGVRPAPAVWSPLEYGCHVRDVFTIFGGRATSMLVEDDPLFDNWDQDATALEQRYAEQVPGLVSADLVVAAEKTTAVFASVADGDWTRPGRRSNGSVFTVDSLGRYFLHDVVHHLHDVQG